MFRAIQLASEYVDRFRAATSLKSLGNERYAIICTDEDGLASILTDLEQRLQGRDNFDDPRYKALAEKASLSFTELVNLKDTKQQKRVELGDLGEAISCLSLLTYFDCEHTMLFPKNLGKLNARVSDPGIDVVVIRLADDTSSDSMEFIESKATGKDGRDFSALFSSAKRTTSGITRDRVYDELQLLSEEIKERNLAVDAPERVRLLVFSYLDDRVGQSAHLHAKDPPASDVGTSSASKISKVVMFQADMDSLRAKTFAYRRIA